MSSICSWILSRGFSLADCRDGLCKNNVQYVYMVIFVAIYFRKILFITKINCSQKYMSRVMRKPTFCICENKDADQLRGNREADQHLCFRYIDSILPLLSKSEISSLQPSSVAVQPGLCRTRSETRMLVFS